MTQQQLADAGSFARLYHCWRKADERFDNTTTSHDQRQALAILSRLEQAGRNWHPKRPELMFNKITVLLVRPVANIVVHMRSKYKFEEISNALWNLVESQLRELDRNMAAFFEMWPEACPEAYDATLLTRASEAHLLK